MHDLAQYVGLHTSSGMQKPGMVDGTVDGMVLIWYNMVWFAKVRLGMVGGLAGMV